MDPGLEQWQWLRERIVEEWGDQGAHLRAFDRILWRAREARDLRVALHVTASALSWCAGGLQDSRKVLPQHVQNALDLALSALAREDVRE